MFSSRRFFTPAPSSFGHHRFSSDISTVYVFSPPSSQRHLSTPCPPISLQAPTTTDGFFLFSLVFTSLDCIAWLLAKPEKYTKLERKCEFVILRGALRILSLDKIPLLNHCTRIITTYCACSLYYSSI